MKKPLFFLLLTCVLTVGAGAVINETTGKQLHVWSNDTNDYKAKVTAIDSITCIDKVRVWVNNVIAYEKEVEIIDSLTFEDFIEDPVNPEDTIQYEITRGKFSVGEGKQVYFSLGNLQYQASTQTWRFAEHQYDHIGAGNANIADDYDGWIDLFAWGTNPYADDTTSHLRSLTASEWDYLVYTRQIGREDNLSGHAVVNGVTGYILLPDDYEMPEGITFLGTVGAWYKKNKYTLSQWKRMEAAGAIFLPVTGRRENTKVEAPDSYGYYWSSTIDKDNEELAWNLELFADSAPGNAAQIYTVSSNIQLGYAVRLIEPLFIDTVPVNPDTIPVDTIPEPPTPIDCPEGAIPGLFSVAADKRVYFSRGNLQYIDTIWQFAEHQWDYFGTDQSDGHRDLFGWGTGFTPNMVSRTGTEYWKFVDWGENAISNGGNKENLWQTLTQPEFTYLFFTRENADSLFGLATVNGIKGLIVLPDNWTLPAGVTFVVSTPQDLLDYGCTYKYNSNSNKFSNNTYTAEQWAVMESAGAVFLPAAGWRSNETSVLNVGSYGYYWSATPHVSNNSSANCLYFSTQFLSSANTGARNYGRSVRLVQPEILPDTVKKNIIRHEFSVAESKEVYFSPGNLQYRASTDTWRFAEHQYDTIGAANANISDTYDGWIDLFGWGTGDKPTMSIQDHEYYFYCYHDWGMNPISYPGDTIEHQWRALTSEEWTYLYNTRPNCTHLSGYGKINGVAGYIILPDDWKPREGIEFVGRANSATNTYSLEQWERMEALGAIFLPIAGMRDGTEFKSQRGRYWLSSIEMTFEGCARSLELNPIGIMNATNTWYGYSVRLIEPVVPEVAPPDPEPIAHPEGAVAGLFSVSETKKVYFSQGNLQYKTGTWRFAEHQYDTIGAENANIAVNYEGWIDLFGWGTGDRPWETSTNTSDYLDSYVDWGVNPISNGGNTPKIWATLTSAEWEYVFNGRPNAIELRGNGRVNGVNGYIFLPDDWQLPYGGRFFPNRGRSLSNVYNLEEWARMEAAGAVFLPRAGKRRGTEVSAGDGNYWSSTKIEAYSSVGYFFVGVSEKAGATVISSPPDYAKSVRMVRPQADSIPGDTLPFIPADTIPTINCPEGAIPGLFSVAADKRVYFSRGNLQYVDSIWQFAEHQWDYFGSNQSDDHRDLFGWGTGFEPNKVSTSSSDYDIFVDWGANPITNGGNKDHIWQTLTQKENKYLLLERENADILFGLGTVNGINGLIILPDEWKLPEGATFNPSTTMGMVAEDYEYTNSKSTGFTHNTYTTEQWAVMESAGAVFLPAAGYRNGKTSTSSVGSTGYYWTPTTYTSQPSYANYLSFNNKSVTTASTYSRSQGRSVRLVQPEILPPDTVKPRVRGKFSVGEDKQVYFAPGNLQYQASTKTWRFAEHQYDTIGAANANISDDYDGWIDLFGWGTGDKPTRTIKGWYYYYYCYHDWGMNQISCGNDTTTHQWRAMKYAEWQYLFKTRTNADNLAGHGVVNGLKGYIILPDDFVLPEGLRFKGKTSSWEKNTYSLEDWEKMEYNGAIFLPLTGWREGTEVKKTKEYGHYWLGTLGNRVGSAYAVDFYETGSSYSGYTAKIEVCTELYAIPYAYDGYAVRLIEPVVPEVIPPDPDPIPCPEGAIPGIFSISETKKVYFSKGNLQHSICGWQFAEHQWDYIGQDNDKVELVLGTPLDLFGWGTGDRPSETSTIASDYIGHYAGFGGNPIINGGNKPSMWFTLSKEEWEYLFDKRPNCAKLRCQANVNGVNGYIFLPDDFVLPYGGRFFGDQGRWCANEYTIEEWARMENAGAVFLPAAGSRKGTEVKDVQVHGSYWSSTSDETYNTAAYFIFGQNIDVADNATINNYQYVQSATANTAKSVRLVTLVK